MWIVKKLDNFSNNLALSSTPLKYVCKLSAEMVLFAPFDFSLIFSQEESNSEKERTALFFDENEIENSPFQRSLHEVDADCFGFKKEEEKNVRPKIRQIC